MAPIERSAPSPTAMGGPLLLRPLADEARITVVYDQHRDILEALRAGNSSAAGAAAETHLNTSLRHRLKVMQE